MERICLIPGWAEGEEAKIWAMVDARISVEATVELKSNEMSIWVPQKCRDELNDRLIVRGRRGFTIGVMTDSLRSQATPFGEK